MTNHTHSIIIEYHAGAHAGEIVRHDGIKKQDLLKRIKGITAEQRRNADIIVSYGGVGVYLEDFIVVQHLRRLGYGKTSKDD